MKKLTKLVAFLAMCSIFGSTFASTDEEEKAYLKSFNNPQLNMAIDSNLIDFSKVELTIKNGKVIDLQLNDDFIAPIPGSTNSFRFEIPGTDKSRIQIEKVDGKVKAFFLTKKEFDAIKALKLPRNEQQISKTEVKEALEKIQGNSVKYLWNGVNFTDLWIEIKTSEPNTTIIGWSAPQKEDLVLACDARVFVYGYNECK